MSTENSNGDEHSEQPPLAGRAALGFIGIVFNPVTVTTVAAPTLMNITFLSLRDSLRVATDDWSSTLNALLHEPTVLALVDYRTQLYTLLIVSFFYIAQNIAFYWRRYFERYPAKAARSRLAQDGWAALHAAFVVVVSLGLLGTLLGGGFGSPWLVSLYVPASDTIELTKLPPWNSPVTVARAFLVGAGIYSAITYARYRP